MMCKRFFFSLFTRKKIPSMNIGVKARFNVSRSYITSIFFLSCHWIMVLVWICGIERHWSDTVHRIFTMPLRMRIKNVLLKIDYIFFLHCLFVPFWCQLPTFSLSQWTNSKDSMQKNRIFFSLSSSFTFSVLVYRIENSIFHLNEMHSCENWSKDWRYR